MDEKQICIEEIINHLIMRNMPEEWVDITRGVLHLQLATYKVCLLYTSSRQRKRDKEVEECTQ